MTKRTRSNRAPDASQRQTGSKTNLKPSKGELQADRSALPSEFAPLIEWRPVSDVRPYPRNPRTHSKAQIRQIAASIEEFGFANPVLIDRDDGIIAGHGRVEAAKLLGLQRVPVIRLDHLSETQKRAYVLADNRLTL